MRILVVGASGFLGGEVARRAHLAGHRVVGTYLRGPGSSAAAWWVRLDVRERARVRDLVAAEQPQVVVNAAYRQSEWTATADGAAHVAAAAAEHGAHLVHVSSDAVFSGAAEHYDESAVPDPITPYGAAKAAAETAVRALHPQAALVRTSLILGHGASVHERRVHALASGEQDGVLFTDDVRCPVHVDDLARALLELAQQERGGMFHAVGQDTISRHELGVLIARRDGLDPDALPAGLRARTGPPGALRVHLDSAATRKILRTELRGARRFLV
ncbi:sugar nucleotide-binding protein [Nocardiopsis sp. HNM0947]|uniref:Sugar nucleotide-binding protein n=1 Tax=Nocardiopsis coralli TaxID=2772213 RepID=A0ABR9P6V0_9ACTN|nr:sugar nucleotide-binding protein [Nocardiopsis coralli]MBE2999572.1 sugar nucleotide-binding protein [Nocardiopsis coralli]